MYFIMYTYSYFYINYDYDTSFYFMVMLHSTTGPYGRPMIEIVYGKMILSLHRGCMGDDGPCLTYPGQHQCGHNVLFSGFQYIKTYVYIYCFQNLYVV